MECLGVYAIFLLLYVGMDVMESIRFRLGLVADFAVLGIAAFPLNPGASAFFIYAAAFLPFLIVSVPAVLVLTAVNCGLLVGEALLLHRSVLNYAIPVFFLVLTAVTNIFLARQTQMNSKLRMAQEEIEKLAAMAERERIARDLHDVLGHTLSVIVLKAELAGRLMERDSKRAATEIADVEATARIALAEVREAIGGYRSQGLRTSEGCQNQHTSLRIELSHTSREIKTCELGHFDVGYEDSRAMLTNCAQRIYAVASDCDDFDIELDAKQDRQRTLNHALILGEHHTDLLAHAGIGNRAPITPAPSGCLLRRRSR